MYLQSIYNYMNYKFAYFPKIEIESPGASSSDHWPDIL